MKKAHLFLDNDWRDYKLSFQKLISSFESKKILSKKTCSDWKNNIHGIVLKLKKWNDDYTWSDLRISIQLSNDRLLNDHFLTRNFDSGLSDKQKNKYSTEIELLKKIYLIQKNVEIAFRGWFWDRSKIAFRLRKRYNIIFKDEKLDKFYSYVKEYIDSRDFLPFIKEEIIKKEGAEDLIARIDKLIQEWYIEVDVDSRVIINWFIAKLDEYSDLVPIQKKDEFIEKFKRIRDEKKRTGDNFFKLWALFIFLVILLNWYFFIKNYGITKDYIQFLNSFLWFWIFLLGTELLFIFISTYCFKIYNFYSKLVELYDSHISLIESDFHYQSDPQLSSDVSADLIFQLRKENTQKIHSLPEKAIQLLESKKDFRTGSDFTHKIINKLIDKV